MNLELVGTVYPKNLLRYNVSTALDALVEKSDIIKATLIDGTTAWMAKHSFQFGRCNCCEGFDETEVIKFEGFRSVESNPNQLILTAQYAPEVTQ